MKLNDQMEGIQEPGEGSFRAGFGTNGHGFQFGEGETVGEAICAGVLTALGGKR